ncbi:penicillin-binding transpeptidase domain-containing protein, partial [Streptococcus pneumoniae]
FPITAVQALEYSSNTYMVQTALGLMGQTYQPNMFVGTSNLESAMEKLRSTFGEYGLGTATGIDLPDESTGFVPKEYSFANYITNAFGQFDNYTPMQLAQYVATIANDGV